MKTAQKITRRYSQAFKQKVLNEIESGKYTKAQVSRVYEVPFTSICGWIKKSGRLALLSKIVRIEMKGEKDHLKRLKKEKQDLESALAQAQLRILGLESTLDVIGEEFGIDVKKKLGKQASKKRS